LRRIALRTLFQSKGKALSAVVGVAAAGTLILVQLGLYLGFMLTSSALVMRSGGDVWVMATGTEVLDNAEALGPSARQRLASHPCVRRVRGIIVDYVQVRAPNGELVATQVFGVEGPGDGSPLMPWSMHHGLPSALDAPGRVAIEALDVKKLHVDGEPLGAPLEAGGDVVHIAAMSYGLRSFTLMPYVFTRLPQARRLTRYGDGQATFWVGDLKDASCAPAVIAHVEGEPELDAHTGGEFVEMTQAFWVLNSGVGTVLTFGAVLALVVGMIVIGQTLSAITRSHLRELGTLKALGASRRELAGFVGWQALFLMILDGCLAVVLAFGCRALLGRFGLEVALTRGVLALGGLAVLTMCALAASRSIRVVLQLEANEVMK
jgi:putative ABC transport system permease protein